MGKLCTDGTYFWTVAGTSLWTIALVSNPISRTNPSLTGLIHDHIKCWFSWSAALVHQMIGGTSPWPTALIHNLTHSWLPWHTALIHQIGGTSPWSASLIHNLTKSWLPWLTALIHQIGGTSPWSAALIHNLTNSWLPWLTALIHQTPIPLSIFRSNSKFDENSECSSFKYIAPITTIFCTRHDSNTVVTHAKYRDQPRLFYTRVFWIFVEFRIRSKCA